MAPTQRSSDFIVYVDESGDHGPTSPEYPVFVLAFVLVTKADVADHLAPSISRLKFKHFGHDGIVLHEREVRKTLGPFSVLREAGAREDFYADLGRLIEEAPVQVIASVIRKEALRTLYKDPENPYSLGMVFGLERIAMELRERGDRGTLTVVFESRGKREDGLLELEFRRVCDGANRLCQKLDMTPHFLPKAACNPGLELADLVARPIGQHELRPEAQSRAWDVVEKKLRRNAGGTVRGYGLKVFP
jgi:hypothetical protein